MLKINFQWTSGRFKLEPNFPKSMLTLMSWKSHEKTAGSPRHSTEISSPQATQVVKYFTKQTDPTLPKIDLWIQSHHVCFHTNGLLANIATLAGNLLGSSKPHAPWKNTMGFKCPFMFFVTNLVIWLYSFNLQGTNQVILSLLCRTLIQHILGGAGPAVKFGTPLTISELPPRLWSYTMMFPCNIQKKTETAASQEFIYRPQKKTTYKGKCMIHGVQTYHKSVLMCMQFMAK